MEAKNEAFKMWSLIGELEHVVHLGTCHNFKNDWFSISVLSNCFDYGIIVSPWNLIIYYNDYTRSEVIDP